MKNTILATTLISAFISQPLLAQDDPFTYLDFSFSAANASNLESNEYGSIKGSMSLHENIYMGAEYTSDWHGDDYNYGFTIGLKNQNKYRAISAFSPIANPMNCPWGQKAFSAYLGDNQDNWQQYDACSLLTHSLSTLPILVDQGTADSFLEEELKPERLLQAAEKHGSPLTLRMQEGYDHSYFFIQSFIDDHLAFHHKYLSL